MDVDSVNLYWEKETAGDDGHFICMVEKADGSYLAPPARFEDLPRFLNNHVRGSIRDLNLHGRYGSKTTDEQLKVLLRIRPERFSALALPRTTFTSFVDVDPALFARLFSRGFAFHAKRYAFYQLTLPMMFVLRPSAFFAIEALRSSRELSLLVEEGVQLWGNGMLRMFLTRVRDGDLIDFLNGRCQWSRGCGLPP